MKRVQIIKVCQNTNEIIHISRVTRVLSSQSLKEIAQVIVVPSYYIEPCQRD